MAGTIPSAASVRRVVALVIIAYTVPLLLMSGFVLAWRSGTSDWRPFELFAAFLLLGTAGPVIRRLLTRWRERKRRRRTIDEATRAAILAEVPELAPLTMLVKGAGRGMAVDGRCLLIGAGWLGPAASGTPQADDRFFALAHEARHLAVGSFWLLRGFRLVRAAHLSAAGVVYTAFLLNVAVIFDDPDRVALTTSAILLPYIAGALRAVLDAATNAVEWLLELDADADAVHRCLAAGRPGGIPPVAAAMLPSLDRAGVHPPARLRASVLRGVSARWAEIATLVTGWLSVVIPLAMTTLFARATTNQPDLLDALLAVLSLTSILAAAAAVFAAARPGAGSSTRSFLEAACIVWLRIYITASRLLGWAMVLLTTVLVVKMAAAAWHGVAPGLWDLADFAVFVLAVTTYAKTGSVRLLTPWVVAAAAVDAFRLWVMVWLLHSTGVLPFFDDLTALGSAIRSNPGIIGGEMTRMWAEEILWLAEAAAACVLTSGAVLYSVLRAKAVARGDYGAAKIQATVP